MMFVATLTKPKVLSGIFFCLTLTFFTLGIGDGMEIIASSISAVA